MKKRKALLISLLFALLAVAVFSMVLGFIKDPDYVGLSTAILTLCLVIIAIYGFHSNREAIRLQTSMEYSFEIYKTVSSDEFKKRERNIQNRLSALREQGDICAIDDIEDDDLRKDIHKYCGYMDGVGILVMEHMINPEVFLYKAGIGLLRTFFLLKPFLEITRLKRKTYASHDIEDTLVDQLIGNSVPLYYAHLELLALELRRRGGDMIQEIDDKLEKARKNQKVIKE